MKRTRIYANIVMTLVIVWLLIPLIATIIYSLFESWTGLVPQGFTLDAYKSIFTNNAFLTSMYQTLLVCVVPIVITILVVLLAQLVRSLVLFGGRLKDCRDRVMLFL